MSIYRLIFNYGRVSFRSGYLASVSPWMLYVKLVYAAKYSVYLAELVSFCYARL